MAVIREHKECNFEHHGFFWRAGKGERVSSFDVELHCMAFRSFWIMVRGSLIDYSGI